MTQTRRLPEAWSATALSTMDSTEAAPPLSRLVPAMENQVEQLSELAALEVCGNTSSSCHQSVSATQSGAGETRHRPGVGAWRGHRDEPGGRRVGGGGRAGGQGDDHGGRGGHDEPGEGRDGAAWAGAQGCGHETGPGAWSPPG